MRTAADARLGRFFDHGLPGLHPRRVAFEGGPVGRAGGQEDLTAIAGQQAVITRAKKSIAGFRVREDMPLGAKVTLRGDRMYEFLDRLITIALPRVRDFRGVKGSAFDGRGNYAMGLKEHIVFPEINFDKVDEVWGMDIIICTNADTDAEAKALLKHFNMPFNS